MIKIERNIFNIKINSYYFVNDSFDSDANVHVKAFSHSFIPRENMRSFETLQMDLTKSDENLLMDMHKTTRRQIRRAMEQDLQHVIIDKPTDQDLRDFQIYYNHFAKDKKTHICNAFHMKTMQLLRDKKSLVLMYMKNKENEILCYRVYIVDKNVVMNLYTASHFRLTNTTDLKKLLGQAHRYLIWQSLLYFKKKNYKVYDMGGLTDDNNIRRFKLGFGGEIVTAYSGYEANSIMGSIVLQIRNWKMALASVSGIQ